MRHEYTIWGKGPQWAWNVLSTMLLARNPDSFRAYFRNYETANRYWDAPDGLRYWRGRFEIDRDKPDGVGQRRVTDGGKPSKAIDGPRYAPTGIGLYVQDENDRWWPTDAALAAGYLPCASCSQTERKGAIVASPKDPDRVAAFIAAAKADRGGVLDRDDLAEILRAFPDSAEAAASDQPNLERIERPTTRDNLSISESGMEADMASDFVPKAQVVRKLLELRAREADLGFSGYRGVLTQKAIAEVAGVRVQDVTKAALEMDQLKNESKERSRSAESGPKRVD
jgi:hypothetical protein